MYVFNTESMGRPYTVISLVTGVHSVSSSYGFNDAMIEDCKNQALAKLCNEAAAYGADAVVNTRFELNITGRIVVFAYGTAVRFSGNP